MKIALVHELLTMRGGAERLLKVVSDMFPDAPIYTLLYDERKLGTWFPREKVRTSSLQKYARFLGFNHHLYLPFFPKVIEAWPFDSAPAFAQPSPKLRPASKATAGRKGDTDYDLVISFSSAFMHGVKVGGKTKHICYVHSPARYLWDQTFDVQERLSPVKRWYTSHLFHKLRRWDCEAADRPHKLLASSKAVQRRIELYWRRESDVLYPPVEDCFFQEREPVAMEHPEYFLIVSTLVPYKRIELAIEACNTLKRHLKIVGEGPHRKALEKMAHSLSSRSGPRTAGSSAGPLIEFYGFRSGDELLDLYANAKATIFPGEEDFGLVPLESMAAGTPVIAYRGGGALETILEGETGEFFYEATSKSLLAAMQKSEQKSYSKARCRAQAKKFSREKFEQCFREKIRIAQRGSHRGS